MRQWVWGLALTVGLSGCQLMPTFPDGKQVTGGGGATSREFPDVIQGLNFRDLSSAGQGLIANGGGNLVGSNGNTLVRAGAVQPGAAPAAAPVMGTDMAVMAPTGKVAAEAGKVSPSGGGGAHSGNVWGGLGYGYYGYFGGSGEQMALVSAQEAELPGSKGGLQEIMNTIAAPVLKNWATDARLVSSFATLGADGLLAEGVDSDTSIGSPIGMVKPAVAIALPDRGGPVVEPGGMWSLIYNSTRRNEVLQFHVRRSKTTVIRMRFAPVQLVAERVQVDSAEAVKRLTKAITDKAFQSIEEKSRKDYFTGQSFEQPQTGQWDNEYSRTEVVYAVPGKARWNASLEQSLGKLVWQLNFYSSEGGDVPVPMMGDAEPGAVSSSTSAVSESEPGVSGGSAGMIAPAPCVPSFKPGTQWRQGWFNNSGSGLIDAQTGEVIRFSRPTRSFYRDGKGVVMPIECAPSAVPLPVPSAATTPTPTSAPNSSSGSGAS